ncbi:MAG: efflux RND transporter periplasmic adaptor subunit [Chromatiales bacterium]|jgi:RND family efflux transporter MFP subunit|nr:efflux RND transporter periplasmic adaptor subunit [Chromatiales bacterium]MDX9765834.1 efflux RND transporter periplasmic adaptor subunit [Ectothiorhodospiraceae bacterium]
MSLRHLKLQALGWLLLLPAVQVSAQGGLPFETVVATEQPVERELVWDGRVEAVHQATISAQTSGRIVEMFFDVDDFVTEGAVLMRFRDTEPRARLNQAEASLKEAEARFAEAQAEHERIKGVFERQVVSRADMDRATAALQAARARLDAARAARAQALEQLEYTLIRAPYSGIVTKRHVEVGEMANPGQPLMTGISLDKLRIVTSVPQRYINAVREHVQARVLLDNGIAPVADKLTIFPYADERTGTFNVRLDLPDGVKGLFPGMLVKVAFKVGSRSQLVVPQQAVAYRSEVSGVYVVDEQGGVALRQVRLGQPAGDGAIEVLTGLTAGERVALDPVRAGLYLKQGE